MNVRSVSIYFSSDGRPVLSGGWLDLRDTHRREDSSSYSHPVVWRNLVLVLRHRKGG